MKAYFLIILSIIYSQNQSILVINSNYTNKKNLPYHKWNQLYKVGSNRMPILDNNRLNWFYSMGPYNDTWGTDIYLAKPFIKSKSLFYYPFKNPVLSFRTNHNMYGLDQEVPVFVNILGFNVKKLKVDYKNWHFYCSE